jgi:tetratricopeptide (TPR) repeat protein
VQVELGDYEDALTNAQAIIDRDADDVRGFALRAAALTWQGNAKDAIPVGLYGLESDPSFISLYATLSRAYVDEQRWGEGLDIAERGMSLDGDDAELTRAYAYALQSVGAYDDAATQLERAVGLRPGYLPPQFELAALYLARNSAQRAIDLYDRILALDTFNARAMLRQCLAYLQVGQAERALGFCEDAVTNAPENPETLFHLALLYYSESRFAEALDLFQRCLEFDEGRYDLSCRFRLGLSQYYTGDCASGWALLQESMAIAQAGSGYDATIDNIQQGLDAILNDRACIESAVATVSF